jgi:hypothetical protein
VLFLRLTILSLLITALLFTMDNEEQDMLLSLIP